MVHFTTRRTLDFCGKMSREKIRGGNVERTLVKTAIYSFIASFLLLLVLVDRVRMTTDINGMTSAEEKSYPDYFSMILQYSIIISFIIVISVFLINRYKKQKGK